MKTHPTGSVALPLILLGLVQSLGSSCSPGPSFLDADQDGLDDPLEACLLEANAPTLHFAEGETDFPARFTWFVERSVLHTSFVPTGPCCLDPTQILNQVATDGLTATDYHAFRRNTVDTFQIDLNPASPDLGEWRHGEQDPNTLMREGNIGLYGHVTPLAYSNEKSKRVHVIVIQYFLFFPDNDTHPQRLYDVTFCERVSAAYAAGLAAILSIPCGIIYVACYFAEFAAFFALADGVCNGILEDQFNNYNHAADWCAYEVFVDATTHDPVVQIWYHHGHKILWYRADYFPPDTVRKHKADDDFTLATTFTLTTQHGAWQGTYSEDIVKPRLAQHGDVFVGITGHEFWPESGNDQWQGLFETYGVYTEHDTASSLTYQTHSIPNIGEIAFPMLVTEPGYGPSAFLCHYNGRWGSSDHSPMPLMHNSGMTFQWPNYRHLHVDAAGDWAGGPGEDLPFPNGSFGRPMRTLTEAVGAIEEPQAGETIDRVTHITLDGGDYSEPSVVHIDKPVKLRARSGRATVGR